MPTRASWTALTDPQLLAQCEIDTYRASGPGGQKRNKTSSAVRLRHPPSGLIVIAEESRSQHENKAKALRRLRQAFVLKIREPIADEDLGSLGERAELMQAKTSTGRLDAGRRDPRFWLAAALVLDVLDKTSARLAEAAALIGISTGNLVDFLQIDPKVWDEANHLREGHGQKRMKADR